MSQDLSVCVVNLGCRVNRVELDDIAQELEELGCRIVNAEEASVIVVNTCAVTGEAEKKCRKAIRRAASLPQKPYVVSCGCMANLFAEQTAELGEKVIVEMDKSKVGKLCASLLNIDSKPQTSCDLVHEAVTPSGRTRPGIKIQDGCDNRCSFCIVWKARGPSRSRPLEEVLKRIEAAQARGAQEVVLTGINLGHYNVYDNSYGQVDLSELLRIILDTSDIGRVRLSSVEPPECTEKLVDVMAQASERVAPFLHLPLQAGCDATLERMRRLYSCSDFERKVDMIRSKIDHIALASDVIVGFPGESDADFEESLAFCERMQFANMHIFRYSSRPGTWAAHAAHQVPPNVRNERSKRLHALAQESRKAYVASRVGADELVCVERRGRASTGGLIEVLVDDDLAVGELVRICANATAANGLVLDARSF